MSSAFAIAAVTAVLKDLLNDGLADHDLSSAGSVAVTALPPDRIVTGNSEPSQINLFLYLVTPNIGWRNFDLPSRDRDGARLTNPPLALDLHYLVTTYGAKEFHAEALLGYAMQLLHENPILTRQMINQTLKPRLPSDVTIPPELKMLSTSDLAEQVESIKICPQTLTTEEISRLWTATQSHYRPTAAYQISVVLIQETKTVRSALPVLKQGREDLGPTALADLIPPFPSLHHVELPKNQISALLNDQITIVGDHLAGDNDDPAQVMLTVMLINQWLDAPIPVAVPFPQRSERSIRFTIPHQVQSYYPPGFYRAAVQVAPSGKPEEMRESNELPLLVAPRIIALNGTPLPALPNPPLSITRTNPQPNGLGDVTLQIKCSPEVLVERIPPAGSVPEQFTLRQSVLLLMGDRTITAEAHPARTAQQPDRTETLTFVVKAIAAGTYRLRLRIDGVDSLLIDRSDPSQPKFDESQKVKLT